MKRRTILMGLVASALLLRLAVVFVISNFATTPGYESALIADNLLGGRGYSMALYGAPVRPVAYMYPLYSLFVTAHYATVGKAAAIELTQALLGALACAVVYLLGEKLWGRRVALWAGVLCATYPIYVYWVTRLQPLTLEILLLALTALAVLWAAEADSRGRWLCAGALNGLCALSKPIYVVFSLAWLVWAYTRGQKTLRELAPGLGAFFLATALVILPWTVRNRVTLGEWIPVSTNAGYNLWAGNNPQATGSSFAADHLGMDTKVDDALKAELTAAPNDAAQDRIFFDRAKSYIAADPFGMVRRIPARLRALWWFDDEMPSDYGRSRRVVYLALLVPALLGMFVARRTWRQLSGLYMVFPIMTAAYMPFYGCARFRYVLEWGFMLFAAYAIDHVVQRLTHGAGTAKGDENGS